MAETIKIVADGKEFEIPRKVAEMSQTLIDLIEADFDDDSSIPLDKISPKIMTKVIEYCTHRQAHPYTQDELKDPRSLDFFEVNGNFDRDFIELDKDTLIQLTLAANYLAIKPLTDLCCKKIAYIIKKCKNPDEISKVFGIEPSQDEDLKKLREETEWIAE